MKQQYPRIEVGTYTPPYAASFSEEQNGQMIQAVNAFQPDVLFVGMTAPKQEKWLFRFREELQVPISMGVGSTFDYLAGRLRRAPAWMQRAGIEWVYRMMQEPRRLWRRYLVEDAPFVYHVVRQRLRQRNPLVPRGGLRA